MSFPAKSNRDSGSGVTDSSGSGLLNGSGVLDDADIQEISRDLPGDGIFDTLNSGTTPLDTTASSYPIPANGTGIDPIPGENALLFGDFDSPRVANTTIPPLFPSYLYLQLQLQPQQISSLDQNVGGQLGQLGQLGHLTGTNPINNASAKINGLASSKFTNLNSNNNNNGNANVNVNAYGNGGGNDGFSFNDAYNVSAKHVPSSSSGTGASTSAIPPNLTGNSAASAAAGNLRAMIHSGGKYYQNVNFPPMPQLSESVLPPTGLSVQPLAILSKAANDARSMAAAKRKKEASGPKQRPAFVMKIWSMVNDPANHEYIRWNDDGKTFEVFHREDFMKNILPKYFKHNNFASFVRQLNMYGWHKVQEVTSGSLNLSKDDKNAEEIWKFENPYFVQGREDLLDKIIRNKSLSSESENDQLNFQLVLNELDQIKMNQLTISEDLRRIRKDNKMLWDENYLTRERHQHQAQTLDKILKFLAAVYGNNANKILEIPFDSSAAELVNNQMNVPQSPNPYTLVHVSPFQKPRLMISNQAYANSPDTMGNIGGKSPKLASMNRSGTGNSIDTGSSIEDIMRSYEGTPRNPYAYQHQQQQQQQQHNMNESIPNPVNSIPQNSNAHRIFEKIMRENPAATAGTSIASPRQYFPELNLNSPGMGGANEFRIATPIADHPHDFTLPHDINTGNDLIDNVEQNIEKQDKSISLVHEWILKLAEEQKKHNDETNDNDNDDDDDRGLDDFDVNEFLDNHSGTPGGGPGPLVVTPGSGSDSPRMKRPAEDETREVKRTRRG